MSTLPDNTNLDLQLLSYNAVMLLALTNADRCSGLVALDLNFRIYQTNGVKFVIPGLTKSSHRGPPIEAFHPKFTDNPKLCPLLALQAYEERTKEYRKKSSTHFLFPLRNLSSQ